MMTQTQTVDTFSYIQQTVIVRMELHYVWEMTPQLAIVHLRFIVDTTKLQIIMNFKVGPIKLSM